MLTHPRYEQAPEVLVDENGQPIIPDRYRLTLRPQNVATTHFTHSKRNGSGIWPGWDYPPSMPSSHAPAVLALLYFVPEVRSAMLERQFGKRLYTSKTVDQGKRLSLYVTLFYTRLTKNGRSTNFMHRARFSFP